METTLPESNIAHAFFGTHVQRDFDLQFSENKSKINRNNRLERVWDAVCAPHVPELGRGALTACRTGTVISQIPTGIFPKPKLHREKRKTKATAEVPARETATGDLYPPRSKPRADPSLCRSRQDPGHPVIT